MPTWYILVITKPAMEHSVYNALGKMSEVEYIHPLFGEWDIIFKIKHDSEELLKGFMMEKVKSIDGILATKTLVGL